MFKEEVIYCHECHFKDGIFIKLISDNLEQLDVYSS